MAFTVYHMYLCAATVSALTSIFMIALLYHKTKQLKTNLISQALMLYGCFDVMGACSWYLGNKYTTTYEICSIQEYLFQASNLLKALTTVLISLLACYVVKELKSPQWSPYFLKIVGFLYFLPFCVLALSIYFESSAAFCGINDDRKNVAYLAVFLPPLYMCVAFNFVMYGVIKKRAKHIVQFFSVIYQTSSASVDAQLLVIVNKLRIYPNVFCFCLLPEVVYILIQIIADIRVVPLGIIAGICLNSSGTLVAVCYLYQQYYRYYSEPPSSIRTEAAAGEGTIGDVCKSQGDGDSANLESRGSVISASDSSKSSSSQNPILAIAALTTETSFPSSSYSTASRV